MKSPWNTAATALNASRRSFGLCTSWCSGRSRSPNRSTPFFARIANSSSRTGQRHRSSRFCRAADLPAAWRAVPAVFGGHGGFNAGGRDTVHGPGRHTAHCVRLAGLRTRVHHALGAALRTGRSRWNFVCLALRCGAGDPHVRHLPGPECSRIPGAFPVASVDAVVHGAGRWSREDGGDNPSGRAACRDGGVRSAAADVIALGIRRHRSSLSEFRGAR